MSIPEYHCTEGHTIQPKDWEQVEALRQMLRNAREKLVLYRQAHSGEYIGGVEYNTLIHSIDAALTPVDGRAES